MVAISILTMLMGMLTTTIVKGMELSRNMGVRLDNINQAQTGMEATAKTLRTAVLPAQLVDITCVGCGETALVQATPSAITFYANLNNIGQGPSLMKYYVQADPVLPYANLIQTTQAPQILADGKYSFCNATAPGCVVWKRVVTRGLSPTAKPFLYYDFNGVRMSSGALAGEDLANVNSIDVTLAVQTNTVQKKAPTNTIVQRVQLPNADINVIVLP